MNLVIDSRFRSARLGILSIGYPVCIQKTNLPSREKVDEYLYLWGQRPEGGASYYKSSTKMGFKGGEQWQEAGKNCDRIRAARMH